MFPFARFPREDNEFFPQGGMTRPGLPHSEIPGS